MARRFAEFLLVVFGEVLDIAEADLAGDLRDRLAGGQQHFTGQLQAEGGEAGRFCHGLNLLSIHVEIHPCFCGFEANSLASPTKR